MEVTVSASGEAVLVLRGEHDLATLPDLRGRIGELVADHPALVVDLADVTFADSSTLGALIGGQRRARERGSGYAIALGDGPTPARRLFDVTGLHAAVPTFDSAEAALEAVRATP